MDFILIAVAVLGGIGLIAALVLYVCSKKFAVFETRASQRLPRRCPVPTVVVAALPVVAVWPMRSSRVPTPAVSTG